MVLANWLEAFSMLIFPRMGTFSFSRFHFTLPSSVLTAATNRAVRSSIPNRIQRICFWKNADTEISAFVDGGISPPSSSKIPLTVGITFTITTIITTTAIIMTNTG